MNYDIFGNVVGADTPKTLEEEYSDYINSSAWKKIRDAKIKQAGGKCERCGISKWSSRLDVHHKNYKHFKHERPEDLEVLCTGCHEKADQKRKEKVEEKRDNSPLVVGFENWMDRGNNPNWRRWSDSKLSSAWDRFLRVISNNTGREYNKPFNRSSRW